MNKKLAADYIERFQDILDELDALEMTEALEEINAEFEDAIFSMECIDFDDEDAQEEMEDAMEEVASLLQDYTELKNETEIELPELAGLLDQLALCLNQAEQALFPDKTVIRLHFGRS